MGQELKTSLQLADERIILSKYAEENAKKEKKENERLRQEQEELYAQYPGLRDLLLGTGEEKREFVEHKPTQLLTKPLFKKDKKDKIDKKILSDEIKSVEGYTINMNQKSPELIWHGSFHYYGGFSRMNRTMVFGLTERGAIVKIEPDDYMHEINSATKSQLKELEGVEVSKHAPKVFGTTVPLDMIHSGKKIMYTMMETSGGLHKNYVEKLNLFNEIWVPTHWGKDLYESSGVQVPIKIMPLGVDTKRYCQDAKPFNFGVDLNGFSFLSVFKWSPRKGYDILLKAYLEEFTSDENVSLLLVARCFIDNNPMKIQNDFKNIVSGIKNKNLPHVVLYDKAIPEKDMPGVYTAANAFVMISNGEGFGLPYCEAGACGLPVIASNCTGQTEFLNKDNSFLVDPEGYEVADRFSEMGKLSHFYENQQFPIFGQDAIDKTRKHMRYVFEHQKEAQQKNKKLQKSLNQNYTWEHACDRVYKRISELQEE